jgi:hypothetical protein
VWRLLPITEQPEIGAREAMRLIARADGAELWVIGRDRGDGVVGVLALGGPSLKLPSELGGRLHPGLDRVMSEHLPTLSERPVEVIRPPDPFDPATFAARHRQRVAIGGPGALPGTTRGRTQAEAQAIAAALRPTLAACVDAMAQAAADRDAERLARAWLAVSRAL